ncbi:MAG: hypothetical protein J6W65_07685, partial [Oscillospiraceae bacterium]|nr:hypothetical protein [Oscillospiraceae bacterium]
DEIKMVGTDSLQGAKLLAETVLILTEASLLDSLTSWFRGGKNRFAEFGEQIASFAPYIKQYADAIDGIDVSTVEGSTNAAMALAELSKNLPNEGGVVSWFTGDNKLSVFAAYILRYALCTKYIRIMCRILSIITK